jgi:peptidyl-dipeptidase Dcp
MTRLPRFAIVLSVLLVACGRSRITPFTADNPFAEPSALLYQAPAFDRITNADFQPAIEEGMRRQLAEVAAIAADTAAPTFDNTFIALERSGRLLQRAGNVFNALTSANTNDTLQQVQEAVAPRLAAHRDAIFLNATLFQRIRSVHDRRAALGLDSLQRFLVERYYRDFVRAGALLPDSDKTKLRALNQEEATLETRFEQRLLAATKAGAIVVDDSTQLDGLSAGEIGAAAQAAADRKLTGKWLLALRNTTQQPAQASLRNRALRERLFRASTTRAMRGDSNDTREIILRLAQLRPERARLLGFPSLAAYVLDDEMAKTPEGAIRLLTDLAAPATAKARGEAAAMQRLIDAQRGGFALAPWDWQYYAERVRVAEYALDEEQIKPYFELDRVLRDGVFYMANQLYGLTFRERTDLPAYHPDVHVFEVLDADGTSIGLFYADYFKRDNKQGGAWSGAFVDGSPLLGTKPVIYNVCNFTKPAAGQPALLTTDDVETVFHEFGHGLHGLLNTVRYPRLANNVPTDFVEVPSQFHEHWALNPAVFAHYARHYRTGAPMPAALVQKLVRTKTFNQGFITTEYVAAALLDLAWHTLPAGERQANVDSFEVAALRRYQVDLPQVPPRYMTNYFAHIWQSGYSATYYAYIWSEVIDSDAYAWFLEHGGLSRANGQRFRDMILARAGSADAAELYRAFRGRDAVVGPLLERRGLTTGRSAPR